VNLEPNAQRKDSTKASLFVNDVIRKPIGFFMLNKPSQSEEASIPKRSELELN
jgi:hypothetical protein